MSSSQDSLPTIETDSKSGVFPAPSLPFSLPHSSIFLPGRSPSPSTDTKERAVSPVLLCFASGLCGPMWVSFSFPFGEESRG